MFFRYKRYNINIVDIILIFFIILIRYIPISHIYRLSLILSFLNHKILMPIHT